MKKVELFVLLIFSTESLFSQEQQELSAWASVGLGISSFDRSVPSWSVSANVGLAIQLSRFIVKYKRNDHSEFAIFIPQEEARSHEFLLGYSIVLGPQTEVEEFNLFRLSASFGIGSLKQITRGERIINHGFLDDTFEMIKQTSTCYPIELEMKLILSH